MMKCAGLGVSQTIYVTLRILMIKSYYSDDWHEMKINCLVTISNQIKALDFNFVVVLRVQFSSFMC